MKLLAKCPICRTVMELTMEHADKRIRCAVCRRLFKVPDAAAMGRALEVLAQAASDLYVDEQGNFYA